MTDTDHDNFDMTEAEKTAAHTKAVLDGLRAMEADTDDEA